MPTANCSSPVLFTKDSELPTNQASNSGLLFVASDNSYLGQTVDCYGDCNLDNSSENPSISSHLFPTSSARADFEKLNNPVEAYLGQKSDVPGNVFHDHLMGFSPANVQAIEVKHEMLYEFDEELDNILLKDRRKMLLSRKLMQSTRSHIREYDNGGLSNTSKVMLHSEDSDFSQDALISNNMYREANGSEDLASENATDGTFDTDSVFSPPLSVTVMEDDACALENSDLPFLAKVKDEPLDINELCSDGKKFMQDPFVGQTINVKNEPVFSGYFVDEIDHMPLVDRVKLLSSRIPSVDVTGNPEWFKEDDTLALDLDNDAVGSVRPLSISRPRKKRRTATDSVETALEEDAPGLLKVLLERGVSSDEIKLYGEEDSDDALDESQCEDGFAELESVISQLFSQRQTFLKFPLLSTKGVKISYCLSCLLSLVEQTRYLRNRKWPVEWGWCRDLQSFIFVFQRHNRIVLERPEYGYATYFFELLNSVPVAWQIKRLVTAMKLTSCGRITVIENKPLVVGVDLNEAEARVLAEYGWTPNTGLGTMLNYCDRVVHDRKQELDSSEWRMKIGKQLMNGYNGGNIVAQNLPKRLTELQDFQNVQVKLEE